MRDIYVVVPKGTTVYAAADDWDRADMGIVDSVPMGVDVEVVNVNLLEEGD